LAPRESTAEVVNEVAEQLLAEYGEHVSTVAEFAELHAATTRAVAEAEAADFERGRRRDSAVLARTAARRDRDARVSAGPPNADAVESLAAPEAARDARVRRLALEARQRRQDAREAAQMADDHLHAITAGLVVGEASEEDALRALRDRDEARARLEVWELAARAIGEDAAMVGRR
jgi:hypothetical protein